MQEVVTLNALIALAKEHGIDPNAPLWSSSDEEGNSFGIVFSIGIDDEEEATNMLVEDRPYMKDHLPKPVKGRKVFTLYPSV